MNPSPSLQDRDQYIDQIAHQYWEIFSLDATNQEVVRSNLTKMSLAELKKELEALSRYRAEEKAHLQKSLIDIIRIEEDSEKNTTTIPDFNTL